MPRRGQCPGECTHPCGSPAPRHAGLLARPPWQAARGVLRARGAGTGQAQQQLPRAEASRPTRAGPAAALRGLRKRWRHRGAGSASQRPCTRPIDQPARAISPASPPRAAGSSITTIISSSSPTAGRRSAAGRQANQNRSCLSSKGTARYRHRAASIAAREWWRLPMPGFRTPRGYEACWISRAPSPASGR